MSAILPPQYVHALKAVADKTIEDALRLPHDHQLRLIRALAEGMAGWSYGSDEIERGCRIIECDLRDDARANDAGLTLAAYRAAGDDPDDDTPIHAPELTRYWAATKAAAA